MCNQPREAMAVYRRMLEEGYSPNSTTYNALISAYGKAGQLDKVMEVFQVGHAAHSGSAWPSLVCAARLLRTSSLAPPNNCLPPN